MSNVDYRPQQSNIPYWRNVANEGRGSQMTQCLHEACDYAAKLESENEELREALASIVKDRDERSFDIERFVTDELLPSGYWSPSATMVGSGPINRAAPFSPR